MLINMEARTGVEPITVAYETTMIPFHYLATKMVLITGIKPVTYRLQGDCSFY